MSETRIPQPLQPRAADYVANPIPAVTRAALDPAGPHEPLRPATVDEQLAKALELLEAAETEVFRLRGALTSLGRRHDAELVRERRALEGRTHRDARVRALSAELHRCRSMTAIYARGLREVEQYVDAIDDVELPDTLAKIRAQIAAVDE